MSSPAHTKISDVEKLKRCVKNEWADLNHSVIELAVGNEWGQRLYTCICAGGGHFENMTQRWCDYLHVWRFLDNNCQSCLWLFNDPFKCSCNQSFDGLMCHFKFSKVMLAFILGKVGTICTALLSVYSWTCLPISVTEIGSYLTGTEQKKSRYIFKTRCIQYFSPPHANISSDRHDSCEYRHHTIRLRWYHFVSNVSVIHQTGQDNWYSRIQSCRLAVFWKCLSAPWRLSCTCCSQSCCNSRMSLAEPLSIILNRIY